MSFGNYKTFFVHGMARSGRAAAMLLADKGRAVLVSDDSDDVLRALDADADFAHAGDITRVRGADAEKTVEQCDCLVLSPGVPIDHPLVTRARAVGVAVIGEIEAAFHFTHARIVGVTGTNGKSTVVGIIGEILAQSGSDVIVAGNVGTPFSEVVRENDPETLVLELSSFQLDTIDEFRVDVAVLLNVTPDHLDRYHNSLEEYAASKSRILNRAAGETFYVYNADDTYASEFATGYDGPKAAFSSSRRIENGVFVEDGNIHRQWRGNDELILPRGEFTPVGIHNAANATAAVAATIPFGVGADVVRSALRAYRPLPHRMELVRVVGGVAYVNDSKATNVDAALKSLASLDGGAIIILGGRDKEGDFSPLVSFAGRIRLAVLIGEAREKIASVLAGHCETEFANDMTNAVRACSTAAQVGDTVLLAPACASFDMFDSYQHRGEVFRDCVNALTERNKN